MSAQNSTVGDNTDVDGNAEEKKNEQSKAGADAYGIEVENQDDELNPAAQSNRKHSANSKGLLIPPVNFGMVEEDLTRSGMPNELNFPFLTRLRLRTIVYLAHEEIPGALERFVDMEDIELITLVPDEDDVARQWRPISNQVVLEAFRVILDVSKSPVHVMCVGGRHRTGTMIGCVRRLQRWHLSSIFEEYQMYATNKGRLANEQFIELFDTSLVEIPSTPPKWLNAG